MRFFALFSTFILFLFLSKRTRPKINDDQTDSAKFDNNYFDKYHKHSAESGAEHCTEAKTNSEEHYHRIHEKIFWAISTSLTVIAVGASVVAAVFAYRALRDGRDSLVAVQRAFVFPSKFIVEHLYDTTDSNKIIGWRFTPVWENGGATPTKGLNIITGIHPGIFEVGFKFEIKDRVLSFLGPKQGITGESYIIGLEDIYRIKSGQYHIFIWGRAEYRDVFPGSRKHFTNFCREIKIAGDPTIAESGIALIATTFANETDDDYADD